MASAMDDDAVVKDPNSEVEDPLEARFTVPEGSTVNVKKMSDFILRYLAVMGLPERFSEQYLLRSIERKRKIKTMTVITMFNEAPSELDRTLKGVCRNVDHWCEVLGPDAWKQFQVVIVSDGRRQCNPQTLEFLATLGLFNGKHMAEALETPEPIALHLFEATILMADNLNQVHKPLQIIFALKEENGGKLDSHRWFYNAFCAQLRPKYTFLLDVGTKPGATSMWKLYEAMELDKHIGGCCGEITTLSSVHINPIIAAQQFEYKVSTILDKSMESFFGFISVLPGAFSAYRYEAIEGLPLGKYFKQINTPVKDLGPFQGNMYLAEDRILCFEVLAHKGACWTLKYVKDATAGTDVPEKLTSLIRQRRRWLNGSLFATIYVIANFASFWQNSTHSLFRKLLVTVLFMFYWMSLVLTWFLGANFYLMFYFAVNQDDTTATLAIVLNYIFAFITIVQVVLAMGNKPQQMELMYFLSTLGYGVFFFFTVGLSGAYLWDPKPSGGRETGLYSTSTLASIGTFGSYFLSAFLHGEIVPITLSFVQYFFMLPTFLIAFPIYSFCNIHDISWGTKGQDQVNPAKIRNRLEREVLEQEQERRRREQRETESRFKIFRSYLVIGWIASNCVYAGIIMSINDLTSYLDVMFIVFFMFNLFRLVFSIFYIMDRNATVIYRLMCCKSVRNRKKSTIVT